jgi:uncharacterized membrane protein YhiD involved in acid resistance
MKNNVLTKTAFAAATVFSLGVLAGCDHCQPLLLATVITMAVARWLPAAHRCSHNENFAS